MAYNIFVEGDADKQLIKQLTEYLKIDTSQGLIIKTEGCSSLISPKKEHTFLNQMRRMTADGGKNLVIFDADNDFEHKKKELQDWKNCNQVDFELFLFPNNEHNGDLEDLLVNMINPENAPIMNCWQKYEESLKTIELPWRKGHPLTIPAKKTKIYAYLEVLLGTSGSEKNKIKEKNRDYLNENHWNKEASILKNLLYFLSTNLLENSPMDTQI